MRGRRSTEPRLDPFARPDDPLSPMAEFILSLEDEVPYLDAVREYQDEWCDHPKWEVISTEYTISQTHTRHTVRCRDCGKHKVKNGKAKTSVSR